MKLPIHDKCRFYTYSDSPEALNLNAAGYAGRMTVYVNANGYWSDVIQIYLTRGTNWMVEESKAEWQVSISHSSGGRLCKPDVKHYPGCVAIESDVDAEECLGHALIAAASFARELLRHQAELEAAYQLGVEERRAERETERRLKEAALANDPAMGIDQARLLVAKALCTSAHEVVIIAKERGCCAYKTIEVRIGRTTQFTVNGAVTSKAKVLALLAERSITSYIQGEK